MLARSLTVLLVAITAIHLGEKGVKATAPTEASVLAAEVEGCRAYEQNDAAGIRRFLTDDYTLTDSKGTITTKQDDIDDVVRHRVHYTTFRNENMRVRLYPGAAIVTGQTLVKGTAAGTPFDVAVQFTDTLVWIGGRWMLAAGHVSRLRNGPAS